MGTAVWRRRAAAAPATQAARRRPRRAGPRHRQSRQAPMARRPRCRRASCVACCPGAGLLAGKVQGARMPSQQHGRRSCVAVRGSTPVRPCSRTVAQASRGVVGRQRIVQRLCMLHDQHRLVQAPTVPGRLLLLSVLPPRRGRPGAESAANQRHRCSAGLAIGLAQRAEADPSGGRCPLRPRSEPHPVCAESHATAGGSKPRGRGGRAARMGGAPARRCRPLAGQSPAARLATYARCWSGRSSMRAPAASASLAAARAWAASAAAARALPPAAQI